MSLFSRLFAGKAPNAPAQRLADGVIAAGRRPEFYLQELVPDDFDGRFGLVSLHGVLLMRRLKQLGPDGLVLSERMGEALFDRFDYAYREEGVGDSSIARKVRKLGERYFGLARALDSALDGAEPVEDVLKRNGLGGRRAVRLAEWTIAADAALAGQSREPLLGGEVDWPGTPQG